MDVVLRDLKTGRYFAWQKTWVDRAGEAMTFCTVEEAAAAAAGSGVQDVAVVLRYEQPQCELALNPVDCVKVGGRSGGASALAA